MFTIIVWTYDHKLLQESKEGLVNLKGDMKRELRSPETLLHGPYSNRQFG